MITLTGDMTGPGRPVRTGTGIRVKVMGDLFHGRLPERPGIRVTYVGRGAPGLPASRYANAHRIGWCRRCDLEHDQASAVLAYTQDLAADPDLTEAARRDLSGDLACWCPTAKDEAITCHGDVLVRVVAGDDPGELLAQLSTQPSPATAGTPRPRRRVGVAPLRSSRDE